MKEFSSLMYGGDYNPDQWPEETWSDDIRLMKEMNINTVTLPVFSWAKLQVSDDAYNFQWLDRIIQKLDKAGIGIILATPTAAQPAWMSKKYPDMLPVNSWGIKSRHGGRNNFCPNSPSYKIKSRNIAEKMVERYGSLSIIKLWHINNEYGSKCYCENCRLEFISWLKEKYKTLEELNRCWYTDFWSHTIYSWDEVEIPSNLTEILPGRLVDRDGTNFQSIAVDYNRFMSHNILNCFSNEAEVIKQHDPKALITTNIWGVAPPMDLFEVGKRVDIASWDNYPTSDSHPADSAFNHDVIRGVNNGNSFLLMEQTPNQQNWMTVNRLKRPGIMRLWSYQAIAHGSDSVLFFQIKQGLGGCEKYHAAMIPHAGHLDTRIGRELIDLGSELNKFDDLVDSRLPSKIGIIMDWDSWWALDYSSGPSVRLKYLDILKKYYRAFYNGGFQVDIINREADLKNYSIVLAPAFYMVSQKIAGDIQSFVQSGGTFLTTFMSGIVNENDLVYTGGYPGAFRDLLGLWVEEVDALNSGEENKIKLSDSIKYKNSEYDCGLICDVIRIESAEVLASYDKDYYRDSPAITVNEFGNGKAYYVGTDVDPDFLEQFCKSICSVADIEPLMVVPEGVEVSMREKGDDSFYFLLNHNESTVLVTLPEGEWIDLISSKQFSTSIQMEKFDVFILKKIM